MSKRCWPQKEFGRDTKKPKYEYKPPAAPAPAAVAATTSNVIPFIFEASPDFWDDADDDVILLATQKAEKRIPEIGESQMTFSEFGVNIQAATSTQRAPTPPQSSAQILTQLLDDSDDDAFTNLEIPNESDNVFKRPADYTPASQATSTALADKENVTTRRATALHKQLEYLSNRLSVMTAQNKDLKHELDISKSTIIGKCGESALLRDEVRNLKQSLQKLQMEKWRCREEVQNETQDKIDQLNRTIEKREAQLQMKSAECASLKMRRLDDSVRQADMTVVQQVEMPTTSAVAQEAEEVEAAVAVENAKIEEVQAEVESDQLAGGMSMNSAMILELLEKQKSIAYSPTLSTQSRIFLPTFSYALLYDPMSLPQREFCELQIYLVQIMYNNHLVMDADESVELSLRVQPRQIFNENVKKKILASTGRVFQYLGEHANRLDYPKLERFLEYTEFEFERDYLTENRSLIQPTELFVAERLVNLRRFLAGLCLAFTQVPDLIESLLSGRHRGELLLIMASESVEQLGHSCDFREHFAILEGFAAMLQIIISQVPSVGEEGRQIIVELLKRIIFTRPSPWVFCEVAAVLYEIMKSWRDLIDCGFCTNSASHTFMLTRCPAVYRFTRDTCILQVYGGIIHTLFPMHKDLLDEHYSLLISLCHHHANFLIQCFISPPKFMESFVGVYDNDTFEDESTTMSSDGNENSTTTTTTITTKTEITCECYVQLCLSALSLIYQVFYQWERKNKEIESLQVESLSHLAVQLLHIIFCENYMIRLLRDDEITIRHQLRMICEWWSEGATHLNFGNAQMEFLDDLSKSHIIPVLLKDGHCKTDKASEKIKFHAMAGEVLRAEDELPDVISKADAIKQMHEAITDPGPFCQFIVGYSFGFDEESHPKDT